MLGIAGIPGIPFRIPTAHNGKYVKNSTNFSAFLNKQFVRIVDTKRSELHFWRGACGGGGPVVGCSALSKIYQKPRLNVLSWCASTT